MLRSLAVLAFACALLASSSAVHAAEGTGRLNVVLFFIDTLRADRVGCYGYGRPTTPWLDRAAQSGTLFENAYSQATYSLPSYASIFTSLYPLATGVGISNKCLPDHCRTLASIFADNGYRTAAFVGGGHTSHVFGVLRGFQTFDDEVLHGSFFRTVPAALGWLDSRRAAPDDKPFFLLVHGYDVHTPWTPPLGFAERFDPGYRGLAHSREIVRRLDARCLLGNQFHPDLIDPEQLEYLGSQHRTKLSSSARGPSAPPAPAPAAVRGSGEVVPISARDIAHLNAHYDGAASYADVWLGSFISALKCRGLLDRTVLVVAADHGEELGEGGAWGHGMDVVEREMHVPLVMCGPGIAPGKRVADLVELVDLGPTLLDLSGIPPCAEHQGRSLRGLLGRDSRPPVSRTVFGASGGRIAARNDKWHLILDSTGELALFQVTAGRAGAVDLSAGNPEVVQLLRGQIQDWVEKTWRPPEASGGSPDSFIAQFLRRSGYW